MNSSQMYIVLAIVVLAVIALVVLLAGKGKRKKLTPLAGIALAFVISGIVFGESRLVGYGLMGVGVFIAIIDIIIKSKKK